MTARVIAEGLRYSLYVVFHPFKGFWDLKKEKRGGAASAGLILFALVLAFIIRRQFTGFVFNPNESEKMNVLLLIMNILLPFALWCVANWCITTLFDGEGSFIDIFITSAYALTPLILVNVPLVLLSNLISMNEGSVYYFLDAIAVLWAGALLLFGLMTVHQFTLAKTILTALIALLGMVVIVFISLLFVALVQQIFNFGLIIYREMALRYNW